MRQERTYTGRPKADVTNDESRPRNAVEPAPVIPLTLTKRR
jgi:hypothetical protein